MFRLMLNACSRVVRQYFKHLDEGQTFSYKRIEVSLSRVFVLKRGKRGWRTIAQTSDIGVLVAIYLRRGKEPHENQNPFSSTVYTYITFSTSRGKVKKKKVN